jgi:pyruvate/2-oxoglutarate dehydrogenase complex dihydrolipoamide dehydrogenase (E3) component
MTCVAKVVVLRNKGVQGEKEVVGEGEQGEERVVGMHIAAPNAGEIIQGFALAFRKGITYKVGKERI